MTLPDDVEILRKERVRGARLGTGQTVALAWSPRYEGYAVIDAETGGIIEDPVGPYDEALELYQETLYFVKRGQMAEDRDFMMGRGP